MESPRWKNLLMTDEKQWATLPLRIALGVIFLAHGGQKLFGWLGGRGLAGTAGFLAGKLGLSPAMLWAGLVGVGEFGGALLLLLGLFNRLGALAISIIMLVAIFGVHWGAFFMPTGIEFPFALFCSALALLIAGGGRFSLDGWLQRLTGKGK
jgi:putative oxidoreductase